MRHILPIAFSLCFSFSLWGQGAPQGQSQTNLTIPSEYWESPTGQYKVAVNDQLPGLTDHTIFYPEDLSAFPEKDNLPVLVMSGPGCVKTSSAFRPFFTEVASHGYLFIVSGPLQGGVGQNTKEDLLASIEWAWAENYCPDSPFYGKIDLKHISAMGQSCGGIQALDIMDDPRITLLTLFNSGLFSSTPGQSGTMVMGAVQSQPKEKVFGKLRVPIAYFVGDTDAARQNAESDFSYIDNVPALLCVREIPGDAHGGTFREMNGGAFGEATVAWLNWQLKGDEDASMLFKGSPCPLETSSTKWVSVRKKNIDFVKDQATDWPNFKRYENDNASLDGTPEVVLMGDSITDYWVDADPDFFAKNNFVGRGIAGQTVSQMLVRFKQDVINLKPKVVVINGGTNDLCQQMAGMAYYPEETITDNIASMCELAEAAGIKVILTSITPTEHYMPIPTLDAGSRIVEINKKLKAYADSHKGIVYVDYFTPLANSRNGLDPDLSFDGVHPKINGYFVMERLVVDAVKKALKTKKEYYVISEEDMLAKKTAQEEERAARMARFTRPQ